MRTRSPTFSLSPTATCFPTVWQAQGLGVAVIPEITLELMQGSMEAEVYHLSQTPVTWEVSALYREGAYIGQVERDLLEIAKNAMQQHKKKL